MFENETVENYGPVHLHPNEYPIHENEQAMHKCKLGMYPCDDFASNTPDWQSCTHQGPFAMSHATNPSKRYGHPSDMASNNEAGTGCMNLSCMCKNCHGDCKCGAAAPFMGVPFVGTIDWQQLMKYLLIAFALYWLVQKMRI